MPTTGRLRRASVTAALLVLACAVSWNAHAFQTRSSVTTAVTVRDRNGALVSNLTELDFAITEDGRPQTLTRFTAERTPLSVAIVIDTSQSLRGEPIQLTRAAVRRFIDVSLRPDDEVALVSFNHVASIAANWTTDRSRLRASLDALNPTGSTALYDAIFGTLPLFTRRSLQRAAMIVISDGADSASNRTPSQLKQELNGTDLFLYWIAVDHADARPATRINPFTIAEIAGQANGYSEVIPGPESLDAALTRVSDELNHQYTMSYEPTTPANGRMHTVRVTVPKQNYVVRARRGVVR